MQSAYPTAERPPTNSLGSQPTATPTESDEYRWWHGRQARVFISCGQRGVEARLGAQIRDRLRGKMFCPFLAIEAHSSRGLTDEIYRHLRTAEFVVFIDFKRERLSAIRRSYRGSLFTNQELGIASYLRADILPFVEKGIVREGILGSILGNAVEFEDRAKLPELVIDKIDHEGWDAKSRRELYFERNAQQFEDADWPNGTSVRYFHVTLANGHRSEAANDCRVYLAQWKNVGTGKTFDPEPVELKFKHVTNPQVSIVPGRPRSFDAVIVPHEHPSVAIAGVVNPIGMDSGRALAQHTFVGPGDFELEFAVWSREFAEATARAKLHLGTFMKDASLSLVLP